MSTATTAPTTGDAVAHFLTGIEPGTIQITDPAGDVVDSCPLWDVRDVEDVHAHTPIYTTPGDGPRWLALGDPELVAAGHYIVDVVRA